MRLWPQLVFPTTRFDGSGASVKRQQRWGASSTRPLRLRPPRLFVSPWQLHAERQWFHPMTLMCCCSSKTESVAAPHHHTAVLQSPCGFPPPMISRLVIAPAIVGVSNAEREPFPQGAMPTSLSLERSISAFNSLRRKDIVFASFLLEFTGQTKQTKPMVFGGKEAGPQQTHLSDADSLLSAASSNRFLA